MAWQSGCCTRFTDGVLARRCGGAPGRAPSWWCVTATSVAVRLRRPAWRAISGRQVSGSTPRGFVGPDRACPREAVTAAAQWGEDLSGHRSTLLTADLARAADLIVVMAPSQGRAIRERFGRSPRDIVVLGDLDPRSPATRAIRDP